MADGSWWIPLASSALGVAGALGGTWLTQARTNAREDRQWQRQRIDKLRDTSRAAGHQMGPGRPGQAGAAIVATQDLLRALSHAVDV
ncbi:hypothetical protein [Actinoplanes sp. NPDC026619]|uniref:hypothetical protein n=1 Tax=Actinoplanes sp. NPDC026619 TaxID=3155798 RepID=UPI003405442F